MNMFNLFCWPNTSRWPKTSRCKKMIKRARCRLALIKNRRHVIAMQLREDLTELIQNGHEEIAVKRVEQLIQDERLVAAYELLDHLFVFILEQFSYIQRNKDCPPDINEAVSSLIFASARCENFPELYTIRKLFGQYYGQDFATAAVELFPGNLVNQKLIENLAVTVSDDQKYMMVDEITMYNYNCLQVELKDRKENQLVESDDKFVSSFVSEASDTFSLLESTSTETSLWVEYYCVDEMEESDGFVSKYGYCGDQRLSVSCDANDIDQEQPRSERSSIVESGCMMYYQKSCKSPSTQKNGTKCDCPLDQPCYCCIIYYDEECYSRSLTMTSEWPKNYKENLLGTYSCIPRRPRHVHPSLPEFEDIVTLFTALKRERQFTAIGSSHRCPST